MSAPTDRKNEENQPNSDSRDLAPVTQQGSPSQVRQGGEETTNVVEASDPPASAEVKSSVQAIP